MTQTTERRFFPALLGALHQELAEGELILEQNDGTRRAFWEKGDLVYLQSDAAGEQFGNYLIRQGVLNREALQELLSAQDTSRFGDRVVQWGLVSVEERDRLLQRLLEQILLNALEHPLVNVIWEPGPIQDKLSSDLRFHLDHRPLIWESFQQIRDLTFLVDLLYSEPEWRWSSKEDLLVSLSDLSLTPEIAFALSLVGGEPMGYESFMSITGMVEDDAARLIVCLWALGSLSLIDGKMPKFPIQREKRSTGRGSSNFSTGHMPLVDPSAPPPPELKQARDGSPSPAPPVFTPPAAPSQAFVAPPAYVPPPPAPVLPSVPISWSVPVPVPLEPSPVEPPQLKHPPVFERPLSKHPPAPFSDPPPARPSPPQGAERPLPKQPPAFEPPIARPEQSSIWAQLPELQGNPFPPAPVAPPAFHPARPAEPVMNDPVLETDTSPGINEDESSEERARKYLKKAKILLIQGRTGEAIHALEDSVRLDPDSKKSFEAWLMLGRLRLANPAWMNRAVEALQMATRVNPLIAEPWVLMGEIYLKKEFKANAISCYKKALALDPATPVPKDLGLNDTSASAAGSNPTNEGGLVGRIKGMFSKG